MLRSIAFFTGLALVGSPAFAEPAANLRSPVFGPAKGEFTTSLQTTMRAALIAGTYGRVTSMFRTVAHNRDVGGVPNSYHLQGRALDIVRRSGVTHHQIARALQFAGYDLIESLDEGDHSHFAFAASPVPSSSQPDPPAQTANVMVFHTLAADDHGTLQVNPRTEAWNTNDTPGNEKLVKVALDR